MTTSSESTVPPITKEALIQHAQGFVDAFDNAPRNAINRKIKKLSGDIKKSLEKDDPARAATQAQELMDAIQSDGSVPVTQVGSMGDRATRMWTSDTARQNHAAITGYLGAIESYQQQMPTPQRGK